MLIVHHSVVDFALFVRIAYWRLYLDEFLLFMIYEIRLIISVKIRSQKEKEEEKITN